ncbi:MAG: DEAD/DEAH box helicase family protein [Planctomycetota bacterium]
MTYLNPGALEPLFAPWEEPRAHRVRAARAGDPPKIIPGRRPSPIVIAQNLRAAVREWREAFYAGVSDTTRQLLGHWFERPHRQKTADGEEFPFRYFFCQREAIETLVYLKEFRRQSCLSQLVAEFGGPDAETAALGIAPEEDAWGRYAFKVATGAGKTKVMSLAIVWSYFHALRESDSDMARHFVVIAPNLTVYERLKEDFGDGRIFEQDPLIPAEWRGDWNLSVVLQDAAGGAATGGMLYLTNIHRLYDPERRRGREPETYAWVGPAVSKGSALDTGKALRERITAHTRVMVLNDEAHHVWDPGSAWSEAIRFLHEEIRQRGGDGLTAQLDFSATPKDDKAQPFKHIVCDTPLGEAVDAGIVKTPVVGKAADLENEPSDDAGYKYDRHLRLGYERWKLSKAEWEKSGKKALLFVMCEDTKAADQIAARLNGDEVFKELNGRTINLHTNLKGKIKRVGRGADARLEFVESEKEISDEDLKELRKLSRELDQNTSPYCCIVSVLMLREGWDVRNVTTIVPLRPLSAASQVLPEQMLGRGLRRMTPPGQAHELVTVVDHPAVGKLYEQELAQEGLPIEIVDLDQVPKTTVTIFVDEMKDLRALDLVIPQLSPGHQTVETLERFGIEDMKREFGKYKPLPLSGRGVTALDYEGRHLFTGEVVERMKIDLPLLQNPMGAISYFVRQIETVCKVRSLHTTLAPLLQMFLEEILFERRTNLFDPALTARLGDTDVGEHIRAVFVPLVRARSTRTERRAPAAAPTSVTTWKPYQVTHSERHPALPARPTPFNLVPCKLGLEVALTRFLEKADDLAAFAKNAGPQCLRIDYLALGGRLAFYTPDFFVRTRDGNYYLIETKGREDRDVPRKAQAAVAWCAAASAPGCRWEYIYVPQGLLERLSGNTVAALARACAPPLQNLLSEEKEKQAAPLFAAVIEAEAVEKPKPPDFIDAALLDALPSRYRKAVDQAVLLLQFIENHPEMNFAPVFNCLLGCIDEAARGLLLRRLKDVVPTSPADQRTWFEPYLGNADRRQQGFYQHTAQNLRKMLLYGNGTSPLGLLRSCMDYALNDNTKIGGVFDAVRTAFKTKGGRDLLAMVQNMNDFRNTVVAHQNEELGDADCAKRELVSWIKGIHTIGQA